MLLADLVIDTFGLDRGLVGVVRNGVGLGTVIAVVCSWQRNRSILWAMLAGKLSWLYMLYFALTRRPDEVLGFQGADPGARDMRP